MMRGTLIATVAAGFAALVFAGAKPAAATPASAALSYDQNNAGMVEEVGRRERYARKWRRGPRFAHRYHRGPYWYRPYAYYDYPYWRRPGVSLWFGF